MKRILLSLGLLLLAGSALADTAAQAVPERYYQRFTYPSGRYRMPSENNILAYGHAWTDSAGRGIPADGAYRWQLAGGDSCAYYYWENLGPGSYYFGVRDSLFAVPDYAWCGNKVVPDSSIQSSHAFWPKVVESAALADSALGASRLFTSGCIPARAIGLEAVTAAMLAPGIPTTKLQTDARGRIRITSPIFADSASGDTLSFSKIIVPMDSGILTVENPHGTAGRVNAGSFYADTKSFSNVSTDLLGIAADGDTVEIGGGIGGGATIRMDGTTIVRMRGKVFSGDANANTDSLTAWRTRIRGRATFEDWLMADGGFFANGSVALGNAAGDSIIVDGTVRFKSQVTIGDATGDSLRVGASTRFYTAPIVGTAGTAGTVKVTDGAGHTTTYAASALTLTAKPAVVWRGVFSDNSSPGYRMKVYRAGLTPSMPAGGTINDQDGAYTAAQFRVTTVTDSFIVCSSAALSDTVTVWAWPGNN